MIDCPPGHFCFDSAVEGLNMPYLCLPPNYDIRQSHLWGIEKQPDSWPLVLHVMGFLILSVLIFLLIKGEHFK